MGSDGCPLNLLQLSSAIWYTHIKSLNYVLGLTIEGYRSVVAQLKGRRLMIGTWDK